MNVKPGDLFEWVYKYDNSPAVKDEELYSQTMEKYVLCVGVYLCIGVHGQHIYWISDKGLFHACANAFAKRAIVVFALIIPRKVES